MLPLAFAAMVWPARRIWAIRAVESLVALVISKFAIVAVLSLGGAALSSGTNLGNLGNHSITDVLIGLVLLLMGAFTPWALLRLLPLAEIASSAASSLASPARTRARAATELASGMATPAADWAEATIASMQSDARDVSPEPSCVRAQAQLPPKATTAAEGSGDTSTGVPEPQEEPEPNPDPVYNVSDVPIDEMHKPEHKGEWPL
jgi:hypothetical protein